MIALIALVVSVAVYGRMKFDGMNGTAIHPEKLLDWILSRGHGLVIADLRDEASFRSGHIPGAIRYSSCGELGGALPSWAVVVVVGSSETVAEECRDLPMSWRWVKGGHEGWLSYGYPLQKGDGPVRLRSEGGCLKVDNANASVIGFCDD